MNCPVGPERELIASSKNGSHMTMQHSTKSSFSSSSFQSSAWNYTQFKRRWNGDWWIYRNSLWKPLFNTAAQRTSTKVNVQKIHCVKNKVWLPPLFLCVWLHGRSICLTFSLCIIPALFVRLLYFFQTIPPPPFLFITGVSMAEYNPNKLISVCNSRFNMKVNHQRLRSD